MAKRLVMFLMIFFTAVIPLRAESEVLPQTGTQVTVVEHTHTGNPLVTIAAAGGSGSRYTFLKNPQTISRPNYEMLDPNKSAKDFQYDGPYSSRKKVYIFAASVATAGLLAGTLTPVAATAGGATGGAGALAGAGVAVAAAPMATAYIRSRPDPHQNDYEHQAQTVLIKDYRGVQDQTA